MILDHALLYSQLGFSPIPLKYGTKIPAIKEWKPYEKNPAPEPLLRWWFGKEEVNLGVIIREQYIVVDFDNLGSYKVWEMKHHHLSQTRTVRTSRGYHLYFESAVKPQHTFSFDTGELKATGYVVAPPSVHASGKLYKEVLPLPILKIDHWKELELRDIKVVQPKVKRREENGLGIIAEIKNRLSVVDYLSTITSVKPLRNGKWLANCPFHDDHRPSMIVDHMAYCFSGRCPVGQRQLDVVNLYAYVNGLGTREAIKRLASELSI